VFHTARTPAAGDRHETPAIGAQRAARADEWHGRHETPVDRRVAALAARRHGVVATAQLHALGLSDHAIAHRVRHGRLARLHRGVYRVGPIAAPLAREAAALLACGADAALSHVSAAALWGLRASHDGPVHVTVPGASARGRADLRVHRAEVVEATVRDGLRVTTPARTLRDLAAVLAQHDLDRAVEQALVLRLTTHAALAAAPTGRGAAALRRALRTDPALTRSEAERRLLGLVRGAGLPAPRANVRVAGREVDLLWPAQRLVVEVDGFAFHGSRHAFERDRRRDADLVAAGYRVVRFTWRQIAEEPLTVVARLARLLEVADA
jgi:very-short-patch-repair endonuclease